MSKAVDWLRAKGMAKAAKNADREAKEGLIGVITTKSKITVVEVNSETDFVARNEDFQSFVSRVLATAHAEEGADELTVETLMNRTIVEGNQTIQNALVDTVNGIRENISIKRVMSLELPSTDLTAATYVHGRVGLDNAALPPGVLMGSAAGIILLSGERGTDTAEVARRLAMHTVAAKPLFMRLADVPGEVKARETEVAKQQLQEEGSGDKKPEIVDRIVQGKVNKRLGEMCLLEQPHVAEEGSPKVGKFLQKSSLSLEKYALWMLGSA
jgi:elongation factor Ts